MKLYWSLLLLWVIGVYSFAPVRRISVSQSNRLTLSMQDGPVTIFKSRYGDNKYLQTLKSSAGFTKTLWDFSRPHTILGSGISILCIYLFAIPANLWLTAPFRNSMIQSMIPSLLMNLYITGLNQLTDVDIDKINKPYLPLASGELDYTHGVLATLLSGALACYIGKAAAFPLAMTLYGSALLGTIYSIPPIRLKRFPLFAASCIVAVRGSLVNLGFFLQARHQILGQVVGNNIKDLFTYAYRSCPESLLLSMFFAMFGMIIAIMKDIPDIVGDRLFSVKSFSVRLGAKRMFALTQKLLHSLLVLGSIGCLLGVMASLAGLFPSLLPLILVNNTFILKSGNFTIMFCRALSTVFFALMSQDVQRRAIHVKPEISQSIYEYYMHLWTVFYASYAVLPFIR
jgi:homogentisate phytyltransferase / homogentisate geranylgeranyltransferase